MQREILWGLYSAVYILYTPFASGDVRRPPILSVNINPRELAISAYVVAN
jgi:hypothetical protein